MEITKCDVQLRERSQETVYGGGKKDANLGEKEDFLEETAKKASFCY